nr:uncharacterized protein I303_00485 [Kwoniella dejecticola CBS 10117]OBR88668.1 hypothetical protein I303_00485 [Kwoniella dejecticola CBS 10117]
MVPLHQVLSSPLKRAHDTARIVCAQQAKAKLHIDERLTATSAGQAEGRPWEEIKDKFDDMGCEPDEEIAERLHSWLSSLLTTHTPQTSGAATPISPLTPTSASASASAGPASPVLERALSSIKGLPRPGILRTPSKETNHTGGKGVVLVVTHQECISALLKLLTKPSISPTAHGAGVDGAQAETDTQMQLAKSPIDLHVPEQFDFVHTEDGRQIGNTAVAIVRVWWEDSGRPDGEGLEVRGRLEAWGSEEHLQDQWSVMSV